MHFETQEGLDGFVHWLRWYGVRETGIDREDIDTFVHASRTGFESVLEYYFGEQGISRRVSARALALR